MTKLVKMTDYLPVGKDVILIGGALQGAQTAEFLKHHGREVVIVEESDEIGEGIPGDKLRPQLLDWMDKKNVERITGASCQEITKVGLVIATKDGRKQTIKGKTVITTLPLKENKVLYNSIQDIAPEIYAIGDCNKPGLIVDAVADGSRIAREI
jgi:pyruvate/2-oxoglutarate dehydrogenase complex dihydrolipoamide dehydrogenase (E3) component